MQIGKFDRFCLIENFQNVKTWTGGAGGVREDSQMFEKDTKVQTVNLRTRNSNEPIAKQHFLELNKNERC